MNAQKKRQDQKDASDKKVGPGGAGSEAVVSGKPSGAVAKRHATHQKTHKVGQCHADGQGPVGDFLGIVTKVFPGQIRIGNDGISYGHGQLRERQGKKSKRKVGLGGKPER